MTEHVELAQRLTGQMTALITPYTHSGDVDLAGFGQHVRFQLAREVGVLAAAGTIGDSPFLTMEERLGLVRTLAQEMGPDGVSVAGIPSDRPQEALDATAAVRAAGAQAVLVMVPPLLRLTPDEQWGFWRWFDEHTALPFIVYSTPHASSGPVGLNLAGRLASLRHVIAIKDAFADIDRLTRLVPAAGGLPVIGASEKVLPDAIAAGIAGFMTASSCFAPELMWHLWCAGVEGDAERRDEAFLRVVAFRSLFQTEMDQGFPSFMPATRAACEARGLPAGAPRFPLTGVVAERSRAIAERVQEMAAAPFDTIPGQLRSQDRPTR